jgi:hypothetical protein
MKDIDRNEPHDVSGGYQPNNGGCFPTPIDYPHFPLVPDPTLPVEPQPGYTPIA